MVESQREAWQKWRGVLVCKAKLKGERAIYRASRDQAQAWAE